MGLLWLACDRKAVIRYPRHFPGLSTRSGCAAARRIAAAKPASLTGPTTTASGEIRGGYASSMCPATRLMR